MTTYRYDEDGNLAQRDDPDGGQWCYHWDDTGALVQVDRPDGTAVAMTYDALGRRLSKNHAGAVTRWLWDGDTKLHEWQEHGEAPEPRLTLEEESRLRALENSRESFPDLYGDDWPDRWAGLLDDDERAPRAHAIMRARLDPPEPPAIDEAVITWLFEPDTFAPIARLTADTAHSIVCDHLGTPLVVLDDNGRSVTRLTLDTFGRTTLEGDTKLCPFRFLGQYADAETELFENRFRHYDPGTGRYTSRDPIGLRGGLGVYGYVDDPTGWVDTLGLAAKAAPGSACAELTQGQVRQADSTGFFVRWSPGRGVEVVRAPFRYRVKPSGTPRQAQQALRRGQGPRELTRIDEPARSNPTSAWEAHVGGTGSPALRKDGRWKHVPKGTEPPRLKPATLDWLRDHGWDI